jgi:hypothetical protein
MILLSIERVAKIVGPVISLPSREVDSCAGDTDEAGKQRIRRLNAYSSEVI